MRIDRLLAGLFLATSVACASSSSSLRADPSPETLSDSGALADLVSTRTGGDLRVMTFNIQSAIRGLDKVAEVIRSASPDIVALQEVDVGSWRARGLHQPAELARLTGLKYYAHFRTTRLFGGDYGVALLSRYPLESVEQHPLPVLPGTEPRTVARALMKVNGQDVSVYVTHLTQRPFTGGIRVRQSAAIMRLMAADPRPKLLMGDMNDTPDAGSLRLFRHALADAFDLRGKGPAITYPLPLISGLRIDYVLACEHFTPKSSEVLRVNASDHYPLVADLTLFEPAKAPTPEVMARPPETVPASGP
ncbi:endonuclease/exonuclease/phosphatase family protein [Archangium violaceum]|uniref:endonuclease/exonuclease/phosphatase family protein n=1 Tax=Archangium violaceum TaxID=83451 RepID=UPI0006988FAD|nr:endonuclease/exonuclease/phosphatase family protein [Archangium violaceum]